MPVGEEKGTGVLPRGRACLHNPIFIEKFNMNNGDKMMYKVLWKQERQRGCLDLMCEVSGILPGPPPPPLWEPHSSLCILLSSCELSGNALI